MTQTPDPRKQITCKVTKARKLLGEAIAKRQSGGRRKTMSYMSNAAIELDEARDLSGINGVECDLSHYKDLCGELLKALTDLNRVASKCEEPALDVVLERAEIVIAKANANN